MPFSGNKMNKESETARKEQGKVIKPHSSHMHATALEAHSERETSLNSYGIRNSSGYSEREGLEQFVLSILDFRFSHYNYGAQQSHLPVIRRPHPPGAGRTINNLIIRMRSLLRTFATIIIIPDPSRSHYFAVESSLIQNIYRSR
jgi:hypothetical protein